MFDQNPFAALNNALPPSAMQVYVVLMVLAVIVGTLLDMAHKGSATYFFAKSRKTRGQGRPVDTGSIAVKTAMSHRENVMKKLDVHNRTELVRFAIAHGVVRVDGK